MSVLIITKSDDNPCVENVTTHLTDRGIPVFRFDTDRFPGEVLLTERHGDSGEDFRLEDPAQDATLDFADISAVWYRRQSVGARLPADIDPKLRRPALQEAQVTIQGLLTAIAAFRLDPFENVKLASHKALQLRVARESGLAIPRTLTTNDPAAVRSFWAECDGQMVTKMLSSFAVYDKEGREQVVFTNRMDQEDIDDLKGLDLCPMTFQEELVKEVELRATVVGGQVFCAAVDSAALKGAEVDWRRRGQELCAAWKPYELPAEVSAGLLRLTRHFGLHYGAADFIVCPDGRHVFLEINPGGEFFWLDEILPLSSSLAAVLAGEGRLW